MLGRIRASRSSPWPRSRSASAPTRRCSAWPTRSCCAADHSSRQRDRHRHCRRPRRASPRRVALSYPDYQDVRDQARAFRAWSPFASSSRASPNDRTTGAAQFGMAVSGNLFDTLGVQPALGRRSASTRTASSGAIRSSSSTTICGQRVRRRRRRRRPTIRLGGIEMTVIGVMPADSPGPISSSCRPSTFRSRHCPLQTCRGRADPPGHHEHCGQGSSSRASRSHGREEVALIGEPATQLSRDTNRNQGLAAQTEFDARVEARPQLAVIAAMLITLSLVVLLSRARTSRAFSPAAPRCAPERWRCGWRSAPAACASSGS